MNKIITTMLLVLAVGTAIPALLDAVKGVQWAVAQQAGYNLTVNVVSHEFGAASVFIHIQTANGYSDSRTVSTQGGAYATFSIPPNEGSEVNVCAGGTGFFSGEHCERVTINPNGGDQGVTINAG